MNSAHFVMLSAIRLLTVRGQGLCIIPSLGLLVICLRSVTFILSLSHFENDLGDFVELYQSLIYTLYLSLDKLLHSYSF